MSGNARSSILVIEDDAHIRRMMQLLLEGEGYAVTVAASAAAGMSVASSMAVSHTTAARSFLISCFMNVSPFGLEQT